MPNKYTHIEISNLGLCKCYL